MRDRAVLIIHEKRDDRVPLALDVVAVVATLLARGMEPTFAHVATIGSSAARCDVDDAVFGSESALRERLAQSKPLARIDCDAFGAVVVCDHGQGLSDLAADASFAEIVATCARSPRPLVAIARAPGALASLTADDVAPFLANRRVTHARAVSECADGRDADATRRDLTDVERAMCAAGAEVRFEEVGAEHVVIDGYLLTAQNVRSAESAARTIAAYVPSLVFARRRAS